MQKTLAIIKPDVLRRKLSGFCLSIIEREFEIEKMIYSKLTEELAEEFYIEHKAKPFFSEIIQDITAGPAIIMILKGENVIQKWRDFIGATDPAKAAPNTLRYQFGISIGLNSFHGSLTEEDSSREISIAFKNS